ncbi:chorismate mutase [Cryptosporangium aurantiacum]|uniref:Chorismate mutase n=1 Tax=Cryptosporangium aurantiacum TaxID=134849 RepID=A0A1M7RH78_9ACTN|nr:chorismate mutase [Cryptosporangium aurantiacum]SHN45511.1 chorismate mutase [Cryptosporangium aurantiacum]
MTAPTTEQSNAEIDALRERIDAADAELIRIWRERAELSRQVGVARMAAGGTRLVLAREQKIVDKFRAALGTDGAQLAMLLLRAGRGPL